MVEESKLTLGERASLPTTLGRLPTRRPPSEFPTTISVRMQLIPSQTVLTSLGYNHRCHEGHRQPTRSVCLP